MSASRYPRPGHRLAPDTLRELLDAFVPRRLLNGGGTERIRFAELDENVWTRFTPDVCRRLAEAVVQRVRAELARSSEAVANRLLPRLSDSTRIEDLNLEFRTRNCLSQMHKFGILHDDHDLRNKTVGQLLGFGGFGAKCLVDLLTSMEAEIAARGRGASPEDKDNRKEAGSSQLSGAGPQDHPPLTLSMASLWHLRLPKLPDAVHLSDLPLKERTLVFLRKHRVDERLRGLGDCTVGDLLGLPGFRSCYLKDLLRAVEKCRSGCKPGPAGSPMSSATPAPPDQEIASLEDELRALVSQVSRVSKISPTDRNVRIAMRYFGFDGTAGATLQELADANALTRQRVLQICQRVKAGINHGQLATPFLDRTLCTVARLLPALADTLEATLQEQKLTARKFRLEGLAKAGKLLGRNVPFALEVIEGRRMAIAPAKKRILQRTLFVARKAIARFGVATIADIAALVETGTSSRVAPEFLIGVLQGRPEFQWLDKDTGWFWFRSTSKNRVVSRIRKILSVAEEIEVAELRSGIARHHSMRGYAPPRRVLLELCRQLPNCRVKGTCVRAAPPLDWQQVLAGTEYTMVRVLKERGPVMQRARFEARCLELGMNRSTFYVYLDYSPVIDRFASGVYGLRGAKVEPGTVESLIPQRQRAAIVRLDHGWTKDGKIWIGYRLSESMIRNGVFGVPGGLKRFLQGSFVLKTVDGLSVGTLVVKEASGWGIGPFFRRRGGEPGDTLLIDFDLKTREAHLTIGEESLLEQHQVEQKDTAASS